MIQINMFFKNFIPALKNSEYQKLEQDIINYGCKTPLIVWKKTETEHILIDGHNRYQICSTHKIKFEIDYRNFASEEKALDYIAQYQESRRNLNKLQRIAMIGAHYVSKKKDTAQNLNKGMRTFEHKTETVHTTKLLGSFYNISEKTVQRYSEVYSQLNLVRSWNEKATQLCYELDLATNEINALIGAGITEVIAITDEASLMDCIKIGRSKIKKETKKPVGQNVLQAEQKQEQDEEEPDQSEIEEIVRLRNELKIMAENQAQLIAKNKGLETAINKSPLKITQLQKACTYFEKVLRLKDEAIEVFEADKLSFITEETFESKKRALERVRQLSLNESYFVIY